MSLPVSLTQVIQAATQANQDELHTITIGRVLTYYPTDLTADIEVCIARPLQSANEEVVYEPLGTLPKVPVQFPRTKKYSIVFPLEAGDTVVLLFCETSIAEWRMGAKTGEPADTRRHSIGYPIAIPGLFPDLEPATNATTTPGAMVLGSETSATSKVEITASGIFLGHGASDFIALSSKVDAAIANIRAAFNSHIHPVAGAMPAVIGVPPTTSATLTTIPSQPTTASTLTKSL